MLPVVIRCLSTTTTIDSDALINAVEKIRYLYYSNRAMIMAEWKNVGILRRCLFFGLFYAPNIYGAIVSFSEAKQLSTVGKPFLSILVDSSKGQNKMTEPRKPQPLCSLEKKSEQTRRVTLKSIAAAAGTVFGA